MKTMQKLHVMHIWLHILLQVKHLRIQIKHNSRLGRRSMKASATDEGIAG